MIHGQFVRDAMYQPRFDRFNGSINISTRKTAGYVQ